MLIQFIHMFLIRFVVRKASVCQDRLYIYISYIDMSFVFSIYIYFMGRLDRFRRNTDCDLRIILSRSTLQSFNIDPAK